MPDWNLPMEGGCRCDRLRFRLTRPPMMTGACHCRGCQKMSASAFSVTITVPEDGFEIVSGEPVLGGLHGPEVHQYHCDWCKTWVFTRPPEGMGFVNVRATLLDDPSPAVPFVELFTAEKLPWATTPATHSFAGQPGAMEAWAPLIEEFAAR
jgi:hypothetical protein